MQRINICDASFNRKMSPLMPPRNVIRQVTVMLIASGQCFRFTCRRYESESVNVCAILWRTILNWLNSPGISYYILNVQNIIFQSWCWWNKLYNHSFQWFAYQMHGWKFRTASECMASPIWLNTYLAAESVLKFKVVLSSKDALIVKNRPCVRARTKRTK